MATWHGHPPSQIIVTTASTSTTTATVWYKWNEEYTTASTSNTITWAGMDASVWTDWSQKYWVRYGNHYQTQQAIQEDGNYYAQRLREQAAEQRRVAARLEALAKEAEARAEELLKAHLNDEQRKEFNKKEVFTVISKDGERRYRITRGWSHNVVQIDKHGKKLATFCAHPEQQVPLADNMLAQKLLLEANEEAFLKVANRNVIAA